MWPKSNCTRLKCVDMETDLLHHATSADVVLNVCEDGCFCGIDKLLVMHTHSCYGILVAMCAHSGRLTYGGAESVVTAHLIG